MFYPCCYGGNNKLSPAYILRGASFIVHILQSNLLSDPAADCVRSIFMQDYIISPKQNLFTLILAMLLFTSPSTAVADEVTYYNFPAIEGGTISTEQWAGKPYLVVNTCRL